MKQLQYACIEQFRNMLSGITYEWPPFRVTRRFIELSADIPSTSLICARARKRSVLINPNYRGCDAHRRVSVVPVISGGRVVRRARPPLQRYNTRGARKEPSSGALLCRGRRYRRVSPRTNISLSRPIKSRARSTRLYRVPRNSQSTILRSPLPHRRHN